LIIGAALLKGMGFTAITATNGREALEIFQEQGSRIDLILMDLIMPEMGGTELYHRLRTCSPSVPIVICSGYSNEEVMLDTDGDRFAAEVSKPYNPDQLRNTLLRLLAGKA